MAWDLVIKKGDTETPLEAALQHNSSAVDLSNASVQFYMKKPSSDTPKVDSAATVTDAANGNVKYKFDVSDVDTVGVYLAEFKVTYSDDDVEHFPNDHWLNVKIVKTLS